MGFQVTEVQRALKGADYPASADDLAVLAERNGADRGLVDALRGMGRGDIEGPTGVMEALKGSLGGDAG